MANQEERRVTQEQIDETCQEYEKLRQAYITLRRKNPRHKLLEHAELRHNGKGLGFFMTYYNTYQGKTDKRKVDAYRRYRQDLEKALK